MMKRKKNAHTKTYGENERSGRTRGHSDDGGGNAVDHDERRWNDDSEASARVSWRHLLQFLTLYTTFRCKHDRRKMRTASERDPQMRLQYIAF